MADQNQDQSTVIAKTNNFEENKKHCFCFRRLLTKEASENLKLHQYSGQDLGIFWIYFYNPVSKWLTEQIPKSIAPNTITLVGFIHTILPALILYTMIGTSLVGDLPVWFLYLQAWCYFWGRMLDEMDGKQARRTGNSSPLGLLFDHGCDAFSVGAQVLIYVRFLQVGHNFISPLLVFSCVANFHFTTLEEYYLGTLTLLPCNGVTDGSIAIIGVTLIAAALGSSNFWATPMTQPMFDVTSFGWRGLTVMTLGQAFGLFVGILHVLLAMNKSKWNPHPMQSKHGEKVVLWDLLLQIASYIFWVAIWFTFQVTGTETIANQNPVIVTNISGADPTVIRGTPADTFYIAYIYMFCFLIVYQTINIQIAHVSKQKYKPWSGLYLATTIPMLIVMFVTNFTGLQIKAWIIALVLMAKLTIYLATYIYFVVNEIAEILDIEIFVTKQERLKRDQGQNQTKKSESELRKFIAATAVQSDRMTDQI